jgi:hypothetical protein
METVIAVDDFIAQHIKTETYLVEVTVYHLLRRHVRPRNGMAQRYHDGVDVVDASVHPDAGLRRRVVRFLLLVVVVIIETLGQKEHGDTLGIGGTAADERERDTNQQHQQNSASNA